VVVQRLADDSADGSERAGWLVDLSNRLGELGRWEEALAAIEEAVTIRRQLARDRPAAFLSDLATALNNLADKLSRLNRGAEASAMREEANAAHRRVGSATSRTR
jgi:tetratricopeptide (TPR) repeat protein